MRSRSGVAVEVKSVVGVGSHLLISHLDQLRTDGLRGLVIARLRFREAPDGNTLADEITAMRSLLDREAPQVRGDFDERLLRAGYVDFGREEDDAVRATLQDLCGYHVREDFPRLTSALVPRGIVDASYSVDEHALEPFMMDREATRLFIRGMRGKSA